MKVKITKSWVDKQPFMKPTVDESGKKKYKERYITDTNLRGFGVIIGSSKKTYYAEKRINEKTVRLRFGEHGQITTEQARRKAQKILGSMADGINPTEEKKLAKVKGVTLQQAFDDYLESRKDLKPRTIKDYRDSMSRFFSDWLKKPLAKISKDMVEKRHKFIGEGSSGKAQANLNMRTLRLIFNFAIAKYESADGKPLLKYNPVKRLSEVRGWYKVDRRKSVVKPHELPALFDALDEMDKDGSTKALVSADYFRLLLFTGLRRGEGEKLKWKNIDFKERTLLVTDTKNNRPLKLPLSDYTYDLLKARSDKRVNEYVFPGAGADGHIVEPKRQLHKLRQLSGLTFSHHDLRRTFVSISNTLEISPYTIKRLVNHSTSDDVTSGYIIDSEERLQTTMQRITDAILLKAGRLNKGKVIPINRKKAK